MNYRTVVITLTIFVLYTACTIQKKVAYVFPDAMLKNVRHDYIQQCDKGQVLYDINCGSCHTKFEKRKKIVPDFAEGQLIGYGLRIINTSHEKGLPDSTISEEELGLIMTFLQYKEKNPKSTIK